MSFSSLKDLIDSRKNHIFREMCRRLGQFPWSPYQEFILQTEEGLHRLKTWITLVIRALGGDKNSFFLDQQQSGYVRAIQNFRLEDVSHVYETFRDIMWNIVQGEMGQEGFGLSSPVLEEVHELDEILFSAYKTIANSFLKTREEIITEKVTQLQELHDFVHDIITTLHLRDLSNLIRSRIESLFGMKASLLTFDPTSQIREVYNCPTGEEFTEIHLIIEKTLQEAVTLCIDGSGNIYQGLDQALIKRIVSVPFRAHGRCYGVLALHNNLKGFKFSYKELDLLYQFTYIAAVALENAFLLKELEDRHQELRLLTNRIITIQEEERRRLASDIHDTVAQALTGISFKIQLCKEFIKIRPELLNSQLDDLLEIVFDTIDQCRELISNLRPDLIDTIGLVPALKKLISTYTNATSIQLTSRFVSGLQLPHDIAICLYRTAQEALGNIYKHAGTGTAEILLEKRGKNVILTIIDHGKGFNMSGDLSWTREKNKFGLLLMKERVEAVNGTVSISAGINQGCRIQTIIPVWDRLQCLKSEF